MGLKGDDIRRLEREVRLLTVVAEDLLPVEEGEEDRGVDKSEPEEDRFEAIGGDVEEDRVRCKPLGGEFMICWDGVVGSGLT